VLDSVMLYSVHAHDVQRDTSGHLCLSLIPDRGGEAAIHGVIWEEGRKTYGRKISYK
jgi:hypothetical protein